MPSVIREPTEVEMLKKQVAELEAEVQKKDIELKQAEEKIEKRPSIGYFRARFKGG